MFERHYLRKRARADTLLAMKRFVFPDIKQLKDRAAGGDAEAQFQLGFRYAHGGGVPKNIRKAQEWYLKAARQGHPVARKTLGYMYAAGIGTPEDFSEALRWLSR
jgi:TPR repeat protein